jgi:hypothetical protein
MAVRAPIPPAKQSVDSSTSTTRKRKLSVSTSHPTQADAKKSRPAPLESAQAVELDDFKQFYSLARKFQPSADVAVISQSAALASSVSVSNFTVVYKLGDDWRHDCDAFRAAGACNHSLAAAKLSEEAKPILDADDAAAQSECVQTLAPLRLWLTPSEFYKRVLVAVNDKCQVRRFFPVRRHNNACLTNCSLSAVP